MQFLSGKKPNCVSGTFFSLIHQSIRRSLRTLEKSLCKVEFTASILYESGLLIFPFLKMGVTLAAFQLVMDLYFSPPKESLALVSDKSDIRALQLLVKSTLMSHQRYTWAWVCHDNIKK